MADNARGIHVSPGIYSKETDITHAVKSLGITTLGVVGETLRGPAFQPMLIENWRDFQAMFGGTSTEKFSGSNYPKYELPYIAKSYLKESNQLQVCRVLGLSGYNAGPAWVITASGDDNKKYPIAVLRSRGHYEMYHKVSDNGSCECPAETYDQLFYAVGEPKEERTCTTPKMYNNVIKLDMYSKFVGSGSECEGSFEMEGEKAVDYKVSSVNYGQFKVCGLRGFHEAEADITKETNGYFEYSVSLNPGAKDYILKVLGTNPHDGDAPLYVEALYDVMLRQMIESGEVNKIDGELEFYQVYNVSDYDALAPVSSIMMKAEETLTRKDIGKRFLADAEAVAKGITCHAYDYKTKTIIKDEEVKTVELGKIYTVAQYTDENAKRHYVYKYYDEGTIELDPSTYEFVTAVDKLAETPDGESANANKWATVVLNLVDNRYYRMDAKNEDVAPVTCDMNNYKDSYRFASTPWIVSNIKGDATTIELNKLFRFHTISDGDNANKEIKISIQNVRTDEGTFDVIVRDINDTDESPIVLEKFTKCSMVTGDNGYIAYKIGSYDGLYESKSKFITVEVNETMAAKESVPAGFLGYPLSQYNGLEVSGAGHANMQQPQLKYNLIYDQDVKNRKQYFGLSNRVGVDVDMFTYKGMAAYGDEPEYLTQGFHLDSRLSVDGMVIKVDGESGYTFDCVNLNNRTVMLSEAPIIDTEAQMLGSIYEYIDLRKFTVYFYGGFDGWDAYRDYRTNTDDFKLGKYRGEYNEANGEGVNFNKIMNPEVLGLNQVGMTSDWYAYLAAIRQFANPEEVDINVFATPGIDIINNKTLVEEVIEMIEEERADSIYVVTMPDKPFGASDFVDEMYTPDEVVYELEDTEIDSNYTCTYYPWVKYEDVENNQFIYLPPTKDVVRNMALTDNTAHPWFVPAGISRGDVECARAHYITKLADEDVLYEGRINPIKTFASDGVKIWGQKNLQVRESQLNRIAVRRLLLRLRKLISISCIGLIFGPNDATAKNKFLSTVTPILDNIKANRGISDYKIEVNDTVESRERRELPAKIFFKPINSLEYIVLDFVVTPESVSFDSI